MLFQLPLAIRYLENQEETDAIQVHLESMILLQANDI